MLLARRLNRESNLKIVFPASSLKSGKGMTRYYNHGVSLLEKHFTLEGSRLIDSDVNGLAGTDEARAQEINDAFRNPKIHGLIAGRGGYGSLRLLNAIDFDLIRQFPKPLIGFSDLTILQTAIYAKTGLVSFSGPMLATMDAAGRDALLPMLCSDTTGRELIPANNREDVQVINPGSAEGTLMGGNLFSLVQLFATGFMPRFENVILFFEDINETVDHLDSFLSHLKLAGQLYGVLGVVIGDTDWRETTPLTSSRKHNALFLERIKTIFRREVPVITGVRYGHCDKSITVPIGARAKLDTKTRSLTLLQEVTIG